MAFFKIISQLEMRQAFLFCIPKVFILNHLSQVVMEKV